MEIHITSVGQTHYNLTMVASRADMIRLRNLLGASTGQSERAFINALPTPKDRTKKAQDVLDRFTDTLFNEMYEKVPTK